MLRIIGYGENAGSGFPDILKVWESYGLLEPELEEDTIINQVTLILRFEEAGQYFGSDERKVNQKRDSEIINKRRLSGGRKNERRMSGVLSEGRKNERRLSEVLSEVLNKNDYRKVETIVLYLEEYKSITPKIAAKITGKSVATVRRYLKKLVATGYVKIEGNTSNTRYKL